MKRLLETLAPEHVTLRFSEPPYRQAQDSRWSIDRRTISDYDLFVCSGGAAEFEIEGHVYRLGRASALLVPPHSHFKARFVGPDMFRAVAQHFTLTLFNRVDLFRLIRWRHLVVFGADWDDIERDLNRYVDLYRRGEQPLVQHALFLTVITRFLYAAWQGDAGEEDPPTDAFVLEIAREIHANYHRRDVLTRALRCSPFGEDYTARRFKAAMGLTPVQYLIEYRLRVAKQLLQQGRAVKDVAHLCGYHDELYFSRLFARKEGLPPSRYCFGA